MPLDKGKYDRLIADFTDEIGSIKMNRNDDYKSASGVFWRRIVSKAQAPYTIVEGRTRIFSKSNGVLNLSVRRSGEGLIFPDFSFSIEVYDNEAGWVATEEFLRSVAIKQYREAVLFSLVSEVNDFYAKLGTGYTIRFLPDIFTTTKVVDISTNSLLLSADTTSLFLIETMGGMLQSYKEREEIVIKSANTIAQLLSSSKPPLLSMLLSSGRVGVAKLIRPCFNKRVKSLMTYKGADGKGYYHEGNVFGVVERLDGELSYYLEPFNLITFLKEDIDLISMIEGGLS